MLKNSKKVLYRKFFDFFLCIKIIHHHTSDGFFSRLKKKIKISIKTRQTNPHSFNGYFRFNIWTYLNNSEPSCWEILKVMDSFVCNLHLHGEFNFPLGWTCVKLALKCPSVKTRCLGGCLLFYLKFILRIKKQRANSPASCQNVLWSWKSTIMGKVSLQPKHPKVHPKITSALLCSSHQRQRSLVMLVPPVPV